MKCQKCDRPATTYVTEIVAGQPVEYHLCDTHLQNPDAIKPVPQPPPPTSHAAFWNDPRLREAICDRTVGETLAAHVLPALCLALLDPNPEVRIGAAWRLMQEGPHGRSAITALRDALKDPDERVRKASSIAIHYIEEGQESFW